MRDHTQYSAIAPHRALDPHPNPFDPSTELGTGFAQDGPLPARGRQKPGWMSRASGIVYRSLAGGLRYANPRDEMAGCGAFHRQLVFTTSAQGIANTTSGRGAAGEAQAPRCGGLVRFHFSPRLTETLP